MSFVGRGSFSWLDRYFSYTSTGNVKIHPGTGCRELCAKSAAETSVQCRLKLHLSQQKAPASHRPRLRSAAFLGQERQLGGRGRAQTGQTGDRAFFQHMRNMPRVIYKMPAAVWEDALAGWPATGTNLKSTPALLIHAACVRTRACAHTPTECRNSQRSKDAAKPVHNKSVHNISISPKG